MTTQRQHVMTRPRRMMGFIIRRLTTCILLVMTLSFSASVADAYEIVQQKGVDPRVDYKSLEKYGAWDDRNYELKKEDVDLLEKALRKGAETAGPLPAWFRVKLRREAGLRADQKVE